MSSLLSAVTGTTDETESDQSADPQHGVTGERSESGGSRRRNLALAAAGLGTAFFLRRRRANKRNKESGESTSATAGELNASSSARGNGGRSIRGRLVKTVTSIAASVLVRRAIRRWRKR